MGLQDRNYYDDQQDPWSRDPDFWKNGGAGVRRKRTMVTTLIIINVVIFLIDAFMSPSATSQASWDELKAKDPEAHAELVKKAGAPLNWLAETMALESDVFSKPWKFYSVFTHGFAHSSMSTQRFIFHVGFNMLILFFLGRPVEQRYGADEFLRIYLLAIIVAGLGWLIYQVALGDRPARVVGASGAVSAIVALFVFNFPREKIYLWGIIGMPAWLLGVLVVGGDMLTALNPESNVAWQAHLFGFAFGALYFRMKWNFSWLKFDWLTGLFASKPKLKVHQPDIKAEDLKEKADAILEKISRDGEESLTGKERRILKKYSQSIRKNRS